MKHKRIGVLVLGLIVAFGSYLYFTGVFPRASVIGKYEIFLDWQNGRIINTSVYRVDSTRSRIPVDLRVKATVLSAIRPKVFQISDKNPKLVHFDVIASLFGSREGLLALIKPVPIGVTIVQTRLSPDPTILFDAAERGDLSEINRILNTNHFVNERDTSLRTALFAAVAGGSIDAVRLLLQSGADPNAKDSIGDTPLCYSVRRSHDIVKMLLSAGANPNNESDAGLTPLMYAASAGDPNIVSDLIRAGALLNARTDAGRTALRMALENHEDSVAEVLRKAGASL